MKDHIFSAECGDSIWPDVDNLPACRLVSPVRSCALRAAAPAPLLLRVRTMLRTLAATLCAWEYTYMLLSGGSRLVGRQQPECCWPHSAGGLVRCLGRWMDQRDLNAMPHCLYHHMYVMHEWTHRPDRSRRPSREARCLLSLTVSNFACSFAASCLQVEERQHLRLRCVSAARILLASFASMVYLAAAAHRM